MGDSLDRFLLLGTSGASAYKLAVRVCEASSSLTRLGLQTIDGVTVAEGDRVLLAAQTDPKQNGLYYASGGTWTRALDLSKSSHAKLGMWVPVLEGTARGGSKWELTSPTNGSIRLDVDALTFDRAGVLTSVELASLGPLANATSAATPDTLALRDALGATAVTEIVTEGVRSADNVLRIQSVDGFPTIIAEGDLEVARFGDSAGVATIQGQGASGTVLSSVAGPVAVNAPSGSYVALQENGVDVVRVLDLSGTSQIQGQGASGLSVGTSANFGSLGLSCGPNGVIQCLEGSTEICRISDVAAVSTFDLRGTGGAKVRTETGNLTLEAPSGSQIQFYEGANLCGAIKDSGSYSELSFLGNPSGAAMITAQFMSLTGSSYATIQSPLGTQRFFGAATETSLYAGAAGDTTSPTATHTQSWHGTGGARAQKEYYGTRLTTDATLTTVLSIPISNGGAQIHLKVLACNVASGFVNSYYNILAVRCPAGVAAVPSNDAMQFHEDDAAWAMSVAVSGANVLIQVTGAAATSIRWEAHAQVVLCAAS